MTTTEKPRRGRVHLDDVDHFLGYGWSLERIAEKLNVRVDSIKQARRRAARRAASDQQPAKQSAARSDAEAA
jgi:hypothetical protein